VDVSSVVVDIDGEAMEAVAPFLSSIKNQALVHTSHRHTQEEVRLRVWFPLSRPVLAKDWPRFWPRAMAYLGCTEIADPACKDCGRWYYDPSHPPEAPWMREEIPGPLLDVDAVWAVALAEPPPTPEEGTTAIDRETIKSWVSRLSRKAGMSDLVAPLRLVLDGEPWCTTEGRRHLVARTLTMAIAAEFPGLSPASLGAFFAPSCALMGGEFTPDYIAGLYRGAVRRVSEHEHERAQAKALAERESISLATGGKREQPYRQEEINTWKSEAGGELVKTWIVQKDGAYFARVEGDYSGPYTSKEALTALRRDLCPAQEVGAIQLETVGSTGLPAPKSLQQLANDYGTVVKEVNYSYLATKARLDRKRSRLTLACAPRADLEPAYHEGVDRWLRVFAGSQYAQLAGWIAAVTRLGSPLPILLLVGPPAVGKSALAAGLSRLWQHGMPTELDICMAPFNADMRHCPLAFADEGIPQDFRGRPRTVVLRRIVQERKRAINAKFLPNMELEGCIRVIVAANNLDVIRTDENLTMSDIAAVSERFLQIPITAEAGQFIKDVGTTEFGKWVEHDLPRHALWLRDSIPPQVNAPRFTIETGEDRNLAYTLSTSSPQVSDVCAWIVNFLDHPEKLKLRTDPLAKQVTVKEGRILVSARALTRHWDVYSQRSTTEYRIGRGLDSITVEKVKVVHSGRPVILRAIDQDALLCWAKSAGREEEEVLESIQALEGGTKELLS
jgi:hypothetical protein